MKKSTDTAVYKEEKEDSTHHEDKQDRWRKTLR